MFWYSIIAAFGCGFLSLFMFIGTFVECVDKRYGSAFATGVLALSFSIMTFGAINSARYWKTAPSTEELRAANCVERWESSFGAQWTERGCMVQTGVGLVHEDYVDSFVKTTLAH